MSKTPRTDKAIRGRTIKGYGRVEWVEVKFARQLEEELNAAKAETERLKGEILASYYEGWGMGCVDFNGDWREDRDRDWADSCSKRAMEGTQ
jgi:hypothetical protein